MKNNLIYQTIENKIEKERQLIQYCLDNRWAHEHMARINRRAAFQEVLYIIKNLEKENEDEK